MTARIEKPLRKTLTQEQAAKLLPYDKMAIEAEILTGLSSKDYWFQLTFEITRDCPRNGWAVLESHKR